MIRSPLLFALSLAALWPATVALAAPQQKPLGTFGDWAAVADGGDKRLCYIGSAPKKAEGKYTTRGDAHVLVTHRPADKVKGEVSVSAGYPYKEGKDAEADIDGKKFKLFTRGENAWAYDAAEDRAMVAANESRQATDRSRHIEPRHGDYGYLLAVGF